VRDHDLGRVAWSLDDVAPAPSVVTIGFFDGVHRGHQTLIRRAVTEAEDRGVRSVAVTFDRHPAEVVRPGSQPRYLQSRDRKVAALVDQGVDLVLVLAFDLERSRQPAEEFIETVLGGPLQARKVIVGTNFRFGHKATGDVVMLADHGTSLGYETEAVSLLHLGDTPISSSEIRQHLEAGDVAWAAEALGRPFVVEGAVVRGDGRGRSIGVPTANVQIDERMQVPSGGVYAAWATVVGEREPHPAVVNIGTRPTFGGETVTVEAHLLDGERDLYGIRLVVAFVERLRDERRFDGVDELVTQIHRDIAVAGDVLADRTGPPVPS
jgi:riboflavin kinase/FMN adenylyltransferase